MDEAATLLFDTGFRKPICRLSMTDKCALKSALVDFHCLLKVKAAMDKYMEGLDELGILEMLKEHLGAMRPLFVSPSEHLISSGLL